MALTVSGVQTARPPGAERRRVVEVTFDNSYLAEGEPFKPSDAGLKGFKFVECFITNGTESSVVRAVTCFYKEEKLHLIDSATGKEVESEKDMSKVKALVVCYGW